MQEFPFLIHLNKTQQQSFKGQISNENSDLCEHVFTAAKTITDNKVILLNNKEQKTTNHSQNVFLYTKLLRL